MLRPVRPRFVAVLLVAAGLSGCGGGPSDTEQVQAAVEAFGRATAAKDYQRLCDRLLAPEARRGGRAGGAAVRGRAAPGARRRAGADADDRRDQGRRRQGHRGGQQRRAGRAAVAGHAAAGARRRLLADCVIALSSCLRIMMRSMNLRALRGDVSVLELSRRSGVARNTITALERGEGNPTVDTLYALADALGVPLAALLEARAGVGRGAGGGGRARRGRGARRAPARPLRAAGRVRRAVRDPLPRGRGALGAAAPVRRRGAAARLRRPRAGRAGRRGRSSSARATTRPTPARCRTSTKRSRRPRAPC